MALSGTIQDFGVADIFQLISQQAKTGRLSLSNGAETVMVLFKDGAVVHAESGSASTDRLLGHMLLRAEQIDPKQLRRAVEEQQRTLKRIGSVLVDLGYVEAGAVSRFARLQMTETLYALFRWSRGTYEFETTEVEGPPHGFEAIRAEHVVMNGIRMTDEWPSIREQIPSYGWIVERMRPLPAMKGRSTLDSRRSFGAHSSAAPGHLFYLSGPEDFELSPGAGGEDPVGEAERRVHALIAPGRTVQKLIDISGLGEFETCRALSELIGEGYIRIVKPRPPEAPGQTLRDRARRAMLDAGRVAISAVLVVLAAALVVRGLAARRAPREVELDDRAIERRLEAVQLRILERALEVYRLRNGHYPSSLEGLVADGLLDGRDLAFPYTEAYHYALEGDRYRIRSPLR